MDFDRYVGDYGIEFYGFAHNAATYLVHHPDLGWLGFGGNVTSSPHGTIRIVPRDAFRRRLYLAPFGLFLTLNSGTFQSAVVDPARRTVTVTLSPGTNTVPVARLRLEQAPTAERLGRFAPARALSVQRDAYVVPLGRAFTSVTLRPGQ
jgi:hypothetical protein